LKQDRWLQDGQNRSKVEIVANYVQLLGGKPGSGEANSGSTQGNRSNSGYGNGGSSAPQQGYNSQQQGGPGSSNDDFADDIPF
jgi:single-strand DNA-binding protein